MTDPAVRKRFVVLVSFVYEKNIAINTLVTIRIVLRPIFTMAVIDDIIRKNPTDGVMAEIKKNSGKNKGIRHALTLP